MSQRKSKGKYLVLLGQTTTTRDSNTIINIVPLEFNTKLTFQQKNWPKLSQLQPVNFLKTVHHRKDSRAQSIQEYSYGNIKYLVPPGRTNALCKGNLFIKFSYNKSRKST